MAKCKQTNKKRLKALLLTLVLLLVSCAYIFSACGTDSDDDEDESTNKTDTQTFANGDFEYFDDNDGAYLIPTANSWSRSSGTNALGSSAASSLAKSGTVDTSLDWGTVFTQAKKDYDTYNDYDADDIPDDVDYYTDIDNDYDIPGWDIANDGKEDDETLTDEEIAEAANAANPGTHWEKDSQDEEDNGTHVLMLHNYRSDREQRGTAAKYTSTSLTLEANTAAKVSVWVKTYGMTDYKGNKVEQGNSTRGAYISLNNTVGGSSQDALFVNNINTDGVTENNGWVQYTFYIKASNYASTTFSLVLGLGQGGGDSKLEYVDGYAFFDDVEYTLLTAGEYDEATENLSEDYTYDLNLAASNDLNKKDSSQDTREVKAYALNLYTSFNTLTLTGVTGNLTKDDYGNTVNSYNNTDITDQKDIAGALKTYDAIVNDAVMSTTVTKAFENYPFDKSAEDILLIASYNGANYTAKAGNSFAVPSEGYLAIAFWVKTSAMQGGTGATVTLRDETNTSTIGAVDTTTLTGVTLKDDDNNREDIFDGWQQCYFFVENQTKEELTFTLEFSFGPTTVTGTALSAYREGFAAFTGFEIYEMTEEEFDLKTTGTYAVSVSLLGTSASTTAGGGFDDTAYAPTDRIETDFADARNYDGVYGGANYVGGENLENDSAYNEKNAYENAGLLNKAYAADYTNDTVTAFIKQYNSYTNAVVNADIWWSTILGNDVNQPLFIANPSDTKSAFSYGYVAKSASTLSASSYTTISYRVMLSENATAYLYLVDTTEPDTLEEARYADTLNFASGLSYYYDDNGNLVSKDPEDKDFSSRSDTLLYRQSNGLWAESKNYRGSDYYANLANYETDDDGNLTDASGNVAYYYNDGRYYRYYDEDTGRYSVPVKDFKDAVADGVLTEEQLDAATIQTAQSAKLLQKIVATSETAYKWIYVTFYIANGDTSKSYRLEVWNGSRDGSETMEANSFVIFDKVNGNSLDESSYAEHLTENLLEAYPSYMTEAKIREAYAEDPSQFIKEDGNASLVYYRYSLFDDADYMPYDEDYDEDGTGDPYADYKQSDYSDTVAYFRYNTATTYNTFVNFSAVEKTIAASSSDSDDGDDSTSSDSNQNVWLLISSIVLAVILILTLLAMLVRQLVANIRKGRKNTKNAYSAKRTRYIRKLKLEESRADEDEDDILPDEDEIGEEELYSVDTETKDEETEKTSENGDEKDGE